MVESLLLECVGKLMQTVGIQENTVRLCATECQLWACERITVLQTPLQVEILKVSDVAKG